MARWALIALMFVACAFASTQAPPASPFAEPRAAVRQIFYGKNDWSGCSGVVIAPSLVLTAAHCTDGNVPQVGESRLPASVVRVDEELDIALLRVEVGCPCAALAVQPPVLDEPVIAIGFPLNETMRVQVLTEGRAQGVDKYEKSTRLRVTSQIAVGNSGGGIFALRNGRWELVGVSSSVVLWCRHDGCAPTPHLVLGADTLAIQRFLGTVER